MMFFSAPSKRTSLATNHNKRVANMTTGRSKKRVEGESVIVLIHAVTPRMRKKLATFDQRTFPIAISVFPERLARTDTTNSGILVPIATIVSPIIACEIENLRAIATAPSIRIFPQNERRINQITTEEIARKSIGKR